MTSSPEGRQAAVGLDATGLKAAHRVMFERVAYGDEISPRDMEAAIGAYLSALPAPVAAAPVGVKPIHWPEQCPKGKRVHADGAGWTYTIVHYGEPYIYRWAAEEGSWSDPFETYDGAKAAAQADYDARIRSALIAPAKPAVELVEARTEDEWHEDDGYAVWWTWRDGDWLGEPSYIGSPLCDDWPGYHTHWTPHPAFPAALQAPATPDAQTEVEK